MLSITAVQLFCRSLAAGSLAALLFFREMLHWSSMETSSCPLLSVRSPRVRDRHVAGSATLTVSVSKNQTETEALRRIRVSIQRRRPKRRDPGEATTEGGRPKRGTPTIRFLQALAVLLPSFPFVFLRSMIPLYCSVAFCHSRAMFCFLLRDSSTLATVFRLTFPPEALIC